MTTFTRAFPLDDIQIRAGGDGRTVEAYAAIFDVPTEIVDQQGHYLEQVNSRAFNKTVADRGTRFGVFYNHGKTLHGVSSERGSMPLGSPIEPPRADGRGLLTVTRYNKTAQADEVLEAIRNGDIQGQSFSGRFIASDRAVPRGGFKRSGGGELTLVTRNEIAMIEYGPTPIPAYDVPMMVGVRAGLYPVQLDDLDEEQLALLRASLATSLEAEPDEEPDTSVEAVAEEPQLHSGRQSTAITKLRHRARQIGVL